MRRTQFEIPEEEVRFRFSTSGGPGGQHANKTNTRVELVWEVAETTVLAAKEKAILIERLGPSIRIVVNEYRSQKRNRQLALQRLHERVESSLKEKPERKLTNPSRAAKKRRLDTKRQRGELKRQRRTPASSDYEN
ncbi:MAG: alternative ribosome rescue aminoacyl-tRNA hydrolase ArfB [Actinomycetota bacterium]|nr:alternative ribosome rescue aminoacyl-tRNA hydrolase ArfB [Actinomycetota bacterium]